MSQGNRRHAGSAAALVVCLALALFFGTSAAAQTRGAPTPGPTQQIQFAPAVDCYPIAHADSKTIIRSVDGLLDEYNDGSLWLQLQADLKAILSTCTFAAPLGQITPDDFKLRTFLVTLMSNDHGPYFVVVPQQEPYSMTLLGARSVNAIILGDSKAKSDKAPSDFFIATLVQNQLDAGSASVVRVPAPLVTNKFSLPVKRPAASRRAADLDATMYAYAAPGIVLPFSRASISEAGTVTVEDPASGTSAEVKIATAYANTPKVHLTFTGVAGAVIGSPHGPQRMTVDAGKYASDPLSHSLTMATVAWHPKPYDSSLSEMSQAERWAVLFGAVLTPAAGIGLGVSFGVLRDFAIDGGVIGVWVPSAPSGSGLGSDVTVGSNQNQLGNRFNTALFIGAAYVFRQGR